jgi:tetratricopeptide (TPR) repeat protein
MNRWTPKGLRWRVVAAVCALALGTMPGRGDDPPAPAPEPVPEPAVEPAPEPAMQLAPAVPGDPPDPAPPRPADGIMPAAAMEDLPPAVRSALEDGFMELRVGNNENAIRAFRRGLEDAPNQPRLLFGLGTALIAAERYGEAVETLGLAHEARPDDYTILNNLAWVYATARDIHFRNGVRALEFARRALLLAPEDHHVWSTLAEAYFVQGEYAHAARSAREALRLAEAVRLDPDRIAEYTRQRARCEQAEQAMDILE